MLVDANLLLYAVDNDSPRGADARDWLIDQLNGTRRVGLPWQSLGAFLRIATNHRASADPLSPATAWSLVENWLAAPAAWVPNPGGRYPAILSELLLRHELGANLIPDAMLAALAIEHGLKVCSADTDFARFDEITWVNPLA
jgi:toxin-antitoxin system PIN domain toxin